MLPEDKKEINTMYYIFKDKSKENEENEKKKEMVDNFNDIITLYNSNPAYSKEDDDDYSNCKGLKAFFNESSFDSKSPDETPWKEICFAISEKKIPKRFRGKLFACGG